MPHVVAFGPHPSEFLTHLEAAGYTYTASKTYSESILNTGEAPVAVAVHGSDVALESTQTVLSLLEKNIILLLFSPSVTLLRVVKSAIKTVIDLPEVKLDDNAPLIVFKIRGIDRFQIVSVSKPKQQSTRPAKSNDFELSVKLVKECITQASDPTVLRNLAEDSLIPPAGTVWCPPPTRFTVVDDTFNSDRLALHLWWAVDVYTYATGHTPIPNEDFAPKGGIVYTVMKHSGTFSDESPPKLFRNGSLSTGSTDGLLQVLSESPEGWSSESGTTYSYDVSFNQSVSLFKDQGNTAFDYVLKYESSYTLEKMKQTSSKPDGQTFKIEFKSSESAGHKWLSLPINGLSAWQSNVGKTDVEFTYDFMTQLLAIDESESESESESELTAPQHLTGSNKLSLDLTFDGA